MMLRNKVFVLALLLYVAVMLTLLPAVSAYMVHQTPVVQNEFVPAEVSATIVENFVERSSTEWVKDTIQVKNTSNVEVYVRVHIGTYWVDSKGAIVGKSSDALKNLDSKISSDWIKGDNPNTYYYKYPLPVYNDKVNPVVGITTDLLKNGSDLVLKHDIEKYTNGKITIEYQYNQVVEVFAEVIQANPSKAVTESWGVAIDSSGNITGLKN